ncbi:MAG: hypothetical protein N2442_06720 [Spirochaetes bacterium]|nr:hypothetical protein [Spirochaetota bacterium]
MDDSKGIFTLPEIHRARDCRLYDRKGNRYLDLWRNGGRALLGHRPDKVYRELKNVLQKGVVAEYPSLYTGRLKKALRSLIPGNWEIRIFASLDRALTVGKEILHRLGSSNAQVLEPFRLPDPEQAEQEQNRGVFYRPFYSFPYPQFPLVIPILPFPGAFAPQPLLIGDSFPREELPSDDPVSPVLAATLVRTVWHLIRVSRIALPKWEEWEVYGWNLISCYGIPQFKHSQYQKIFTAFLERKILIPPTPEDPLILPMDWSKGEKALVESTARELIEKGDLYGIG